MKNDADRSGSTEGIDAGSGSGPARVLVDATESGVRVRVHPGLCEGWGNCHRWSPEVYPLDDEGYIAIHMLEVPPELARRAWGGADACPAQAISVIGERPPPVGVVVASGTRTNP